MSDKTTIRFNHIPDEVLRKREVDLTPEQQMARARMEALKQPRPPRGGSPAVKIPPLDAQFIGGKTMEEQAEILSDPTNPLSPAYNPELAMMQQRMSGVSAGTFSPLPPSAQQHPGFRPGVGSMIAGNQPAITSEPQAPYKPHLRPETLESIRALENFRKSAEMKQQQVAEESKKSKEEEAKELEKEMASKKTPFEEIDYRDFQGSMPEEEWNLLNNPSRRKEIESKLSPMKLEDIVLYGEVRQDVEVGPGIVVTYRSVGGDEDLEIKRMMFGEKGGDRYIYDKYTLMQLTLGVVLINNMPLPTHLDKDGNIDEKKFQEKFKKLAKFPLQFLANVGVNYAWFDERVRKLFLFESSELKNG